MSKAAPRYAKALLEALTASGELQARIPTLRAISRIPQELSARLGDPTLSASKRVSVLLATLGNPGPDTILGRFVALLASRRRLGEISTICAELVAQLESRSGVLHGTVQSRQNLSEPQIRTLERALSSPGIRVELASATDPSILGGFRVRLGSQVLDATANNQLNQARKALLSA